MFSIDVVWYLFLGGLGGGSLTLLGVLPLLQKGYLKTSFNGPDKKIITYAYGWTIIILLVAILFLVFELGRSERFYYVLSMPTNSVLTFGSYLLSICIGLAFLLLIIRIFKPEALSTYFGKILNILIIISGIGLALYTGIFLMSFSHVELWSTPLLPIFFLSSAISTGSALLILLVSIYCSDYLDYYLRHQLTRLSQVIHLAEFIIFLLYLLALFLNNKTQWSEPPVNLLLFGRYSEEFWFGFVLPALVIPFIARILFKEYERTSISVVVSVCTLIGGFYLRFCIINAPLL